MYLYKHIMNEIKRYTARQLSIFYEEYKEYNKWDKVIKKSFNSLILSIVPLREIFEDCFCCFEIDWYLIVSRVQEGKIFF